ncbi:Uncharacterised protein [Mycobacterium tuberculosis]|uniref:Uncharacterized protein n=1 Tax=Mycobacterium tuberculosis TaxID=1773 RepID=A0A654ZRU1_MYCTX|nr:Uncharacterised protein [Mycobacterium tuberculosis]CKS44007.1 Uncharacterised protein [Mycobacterium tuberculosis]
MLSSRISSSPQSALTATSPPSLTTASTGIDRPVELNRRHRPRPDDRSLRASTSTASAFPASSNEDASAGAVRTVWGSSDSAGRTGSGYSSEVSSNNSNKPLQRRGKGVSQFIAPCDGSGSSSNDNVPPDEALRDGLERWATICRCARCWSG